MVHGEESRRGEEEERRREEGGREGGEGRGGEGRGEGGAQDCSKQFGSGTAILSSDNNHTHFYTFSSSSYP